MKIIGIIAEYNPFHQGHAYQIRYAREQLGADYIMIVMSGPFTQRGTPAIFNKYERAAMALACGADLILELPVCYATASAEYFADAGVGLLDASGITDTLLCGCETPDPEAIYKTAAFLTDEPADYKKQLQKHLAGGLSYPKARHLALLRQGIDFPMDSANNILAVEYARALLRRKSTMELCCLKRRGEDYHSSRLITASYASASAIREGIFNALSSATDASSALELLGSQIPVQIQPQVTELLRQSAFVHPDDLSLLLHYKLSQETDLSRYFDCTPELSRRILSYRYDFNGYQDLCDLIKTKNVTHSRISRVLCHTLLNITDDLMASHRPGNPMPYLRILGFRRSAEVLLPRLQENTTIPIVTAVARASSLLSADAYRFFQKDIEAADLYRALELRQPRGFLTDGRAASQPKTVQRVSPTEYTRKLLVMES